MRREIHGNNKRVACVILLLFAFLFLSGRQPFLASEQYISLIFKVISPIVVIAYFLFMFALKKQGKSLWEIHCDHVFNKIKIGRIKTFILTLLILSVSTIPVLYPLTWVPSYYVKYFGWYSCSNVEVVSIKEGRRLSNGLALLNVLDYDTGLEYSFFYDDEVVKNSVISLGKAAELCKKESWFGVYVINVRRRY